MWFPRLLFAIGAFAFVANTCVGDVDESATSPFDDVEPAGDAAPGDNPDDTAPMTTSTTTEPVADRLPPLATGIVGAVRADDGTARAILGTDGEA